VVRGSIQCHRASLPTSSCSRVGGRLENALRVHCSLRPGTSGSSCPAASRRPAFEFTQETKDGIPLRFKGIVIYRVTDPVAAARLFDFGHGAGIAQGSNLLTHVCLGELRHAVSHMTMAECIEQRKTVLSGAAEAALLETIRGGEAQDWGITVEVAQLAQVFIVDPELRAQLEAEVRNEIRLKCDHPSPHARGNPVAESPRTSGQGTAVGGRREAVRRDEALEQANVARQRRSKPRRSRPTAGARARAQRSRPAGRDRAKGERRRVRRCGSAGDGDHARELACASSGPGQAVGVELELA